VDVALHYLYYQALWEALNWTEQFFPALSVKLSCSFSFHCFL